MSVHSSVTAGSEIKRNMALFRNSQCTSVLVKRTEEKGIVQTINIILYSSVGNYLIPDFQHVANRMNGKCTFNRIVFLVIL
ncbi:hypothetical protein I7I48_00414 [Histoplasma ohiense]|nr:hypothetical protein I7I48_00414 [Histoplasma ohiense (nom. inval.)]